MSSAAAEIYCLPIPNGEFWQGEILSDVVERRWVGPNDEFQIITHQLAVVLSGDCDLEKDHRSRRSGGQDDDKLLPNVLLGELYPAAMLKQPAGTLNGGLWRQVQQNTLDRYQYLAEVDPAFDAMGRGLDAMAMDFKNYFCIPTVELVRQMLNSTNRRCMLKPPFSQHLAQRFFGYQARIGLPRPHFIKP